MQITRDTAHRFLKANCMTLAVIGVVVLINSVAWAIPLIIGPRIISPSATPAVGSSPIRATTKAPTAGNNRAVSDRVGASPGSIRQVPAVPLPQPRKPLLPPLPSLASSQQADATETTPVHRDAAPLARHAPRTLFPQPEPAPEVLLAPRHAEADKADKPPPTAIANPDASKRPMRDIVLVSPYAPGVRLDAKTGAVESSHLTRSERSSSPSTMETAQAIARQAAARFELLRQRMARFDARTAPLVRAERNSRSAVLPVAPRPPRLIDRLGRALAKSRLDEVRPRLVRRPLTADAAAARSPVTRQHRPEAAGLARVVRLAPSATANAADALIGVDRVRASSSSEHRAARRRRTRDTIRAASRRRSIQSSRRRIVRRQLQARRLTARRDHIRQQVVRRRSARIDGFRRGFYRQLVSANFFGTD